MCCLLFGMFSVCSGSNRRETRESFEFTLFDFFFSLSLQF